MPHFVQHIRHAVQCLGIPDASGSLDEVGGLTTNRCALNAINNDILNKPSTSSEGAAARIKKDEEEAKARREAVRFLGTVDCNYWPEATEALALALRKDPNECVRFEAALSLRNGCCCNEKTVKALSHSVAGDDKDGAPMERSDRVRAAAADALARCPLLKKEVEGNGGEKKTEAVDPAKYYERIDQASRDKVVASARGVLVSLQQANRDPSTSTVRPIHQRSGSLSGIVANSFGPANHAPAPATAHAQATAKPLSVYELVTSRKTKPEYVPIKPDYVSPARAEYPIAPKSNFPAPAKADFLTPAKTDNVVPAKVEILAPTKAEIVPPLKVEVFPPAPMSVPANSPREGGPVIVQGELGAPMPSGLTFPRRSTGYVTMEPARP